MGVKVIAYTALHYGSDYLGYAIRSIIDDVQEYYVLYTPVGSHGHHTAMASPDNRDRLLQIAAQAAGDKLRWIDGQWTHEGAQRDSIHTYTPDVDVVLVLDADEIWPEQLVVAAIGQYSEAVLLGARRWRVPIIHYWRSFRRAVLHDPAYPIRVIFPKVRHTYADNHGAPCINAPMTGKRYINHFGYAQRSEIVAYKLLVHGHRAQFRTDVDWFRDVFMANRQYDCHPVGSEYWNPEPVDPWQYLPAWMKDHPYAGLEVIP